MLNRLGTRVLSWAEAGTPWSNVYGLGRSLLALSSLLTLLFNHSSTLWRPVAGTVGRVPMCSNALQNACLYCLLPKHMELARWLAIALFVVVASGWRPRVTGLLHWWLSIGYMLTASTMEGGDQAAAVLTLLLLPVTLSDPRVWHWAPPPSLENVGPKARTARLLASLVALSALQAIRLQISGIYFHASVAKLLVTEWQDGTAMYYWLTNPVFGAPGAFRGLLRPLLRSAPFLGALTWTPIVVEVALCMGLFATRPVRRVLLWVGLGLHLGILVFMGLFTFSITMFGALVLYLRPTDTPFTFAWGRLRAWFVSRPRMRRIRADQGDSEGYVSS